MDYTYSATVEQFEDGVFIDFPAFDGQAFAGGESLKRAVQSASAVLRLTIADYVDNGYQLPEDDPEGAGMVFCVEVSESFIAESKVISPIEAALVRADARLDRKRMEPSELQERMEAAGWEESDIEDQLADMERNRKSAACGPKGSVLVPAEPKADQEVLEIIPEDGLELTAADIAEITEHCRRAYPGCKTVFACVRDGELGYMPCIKPKGFERIRRITGYLVGTLERFNNGKAAEERERVKHSLGEAEAVRPETEG